MKPDFFLLVSAEDVAGYPVIVEMWDKMKYGRVKRLYEARFSPKERSKHRGFYNKAYEWLLRTGFPSEGVRMKPETVREFTELMNFLGTI